MPIAHSLKRPASAVRQQHDTQIRKHAARLAWLRARPGLLGRLPTATEVPDPEQEETLDEVLRAMKHVHLYGEALAPNHVRWDIRLCVGELRSAA